MTTQDPLDTYITRLRSALAGLTVSDREDIVEEIRAHVVDRVSTSGLSVEETLSRLGPVEDLARDYLSGALVKRARTSFSPLVILRAAFAWAMTGVHGVVAFLVALFGYTIGLSMMISALLKPLFPDQAGFGFWVAPGQFRFGFRPDIGPARELLGPWFMQVTLVLGVLFFIGTTVLMRRLLPKVKYWRKAALRPSEQRGEPGVMHAGGAS